MTFIKTDLTGYGKVTSGNYTGNDTVNRGIPHGLGITPDIILLSTGAGQFYRIIKPGIVEFLSETAVSGYGITAADGTNFYVGNATHYGRTVNAATIVYNWTALG